MQLFVYWFLIPLLFGATFLGLGLLVRALARGLAAELVFPAGIAASIVIAGLLTYVPATTVVAGPALVIGALAGFGLTLRADGRRVLTVLRTHGAWIAAAAASFLVFGASVLLSGDPTFTGYTQIVDIGHQFDIAVWVAHHGRELPAFPVSASDGVIGRTFGVGYPSGSQSVLGVLGRLFDFQIAWGYQPFLSLIAASLVPVLAMLLRPLIASNVFRAAAAFVGSQASILVGYGQIGGIKELFSAVLIALAAGSASRLWDEEDRPVWSTVLPVALAAAAAFSVLSLTLLPWLGLIAIVALVYAVRSGRPVGGVAVRGAVAVALFAVLASPTLIQATHTGGAVTNVQNDADIGNLAEPVTKLAASGVLFTGDHRYPLVGKAKTASTAIGVGVALLALVGLGVAWRRKARELVILSLACLGGLVVIFVIFSPWIELKAMAIMAPVTLVLASVAIASLLSVRRLAPVAWLGLAALLAVVLVADAQRYRGAVLAPHDRLQELADLGHTYDGQGPALLPDFEEQGEFLMRRAQAVSPVNESAQYGFALRPEVLKAKGLRQLSWDLDEIDPVFVQHFPLLVLRRSPGASRPPANYDLDHMGRYYSVWRRNDKPAPTIHAPLSSALEAPADQRACRSFLAREQDSPSVTVATAPDVYAAEFEQAKASPNLVVINPSQMNTRGPGRAEGRVRVPKAGRYELYFGTNAYRKTIVRVNGRQVADYSDHTYALRPDYLTTLDLKAGYQRIELVREGGSLAPGTLEPPEHVIGPVFLIAAGTLFSTLRTTDGASASCTPSMDWLESRN